MIGLRNYITLLLLLAACKSYAQGGQWTWIGGDTLFGQIGNWINPYIEDSSYYPPSLYLSSSWQDDSGRFWLFGGSTYTYDYYLYCWDHVWCYDPITNFWDFKKGDNFVDGFGTYGTQGVPDSNNIPPGRRGSIIWKDHNGLIWMFGGESTTWGFYNDLWTYNMSTNMWTWMKGPNTYEVNGHYGMKGVPAQNNRPPVRSNAAAWVDSNNDLWMFGGYHYGDYVGNEFYSDLWKYSIDSNVWTWIGGPKLTNQAGVYGTKGVPDTLNIPTARSCRSYWSDSDNFYLFGGDSLVPLSFVFGDVWRYNKNTKEWTWISGSVIPSSPGITGIKCIPDSANFPTTRAQSTCVKLNNHQIILFGGFVKWSNGGAGCARDTWIYDYIQNEWSNTWGDSASYDGNFGIQGVYDLNNDPRGKFGAMSWKDNDGNFWVFGGNRCVSGCSESDLWKYTIDTACGIPTFINSSKDNSLSIDMFPNPFRNYFHVNVYSNQKTEIEIQIKSIAGTTLLSRKGTEASLDVNTNSFTAGIYFLIVRSALENNIVKIIKE